MAVPAADEQKLKQRALRRLALALGLIAVAVAGLAVLDRYTGTPAPVETKAPANEPPAIATLPPPKPIAPPPAAEPPSTPPPPPEVEAEQPETREAAPARPAAREAAPAPTPAPSAPAAKAAPAPAAAAKDSSAARAPAALPPATGFVVQLGMFTSVENAQAMLERLKAQNVPAYLETRVVVGPFRDRAEADAAQRKLQAGGVSGVIAQRK